MQRNRKKWPFKNKNKIFFFTIHPRRNIVIRLSIQIILNSCLKYAKRPKKRERETKKKLGKKVNKMRLSINR